MLLKESGQMDPISWKCPYCGHAQTVTASTHDDSAVRIRNDLSKHGPMGGEITSIVCSNADCKEIAIQFALYRALKTPTGWSLAGDPLRSWTLLPESAAKPQPHYIPESILKNYTEACRIRDLSANASAAMSRRCLQGMVRDFCRVKKQTLAQEVNGLRALVDGGQGPRGVSHDTIDAIDHVRSIGNIGAHMEKDINLILDVEPNEAQALIELIELLFDEWYVAKHQREERLERLGAIADKKMAVKEGAQQSPSN